MAMSAPRFVINGRFLCQSATGVQRYADQLVRGLDRRLDGLPASNQCPFVVATPDRPIRDIGLRNIPVHSIGHLSGQLWEQCELPVVCRGHVIISLCNAAPLMADRQVVTIHDAGVFAMPASYGWRFRIWYRFLLRRLARQADVTVTVSEFARQELITRLGASADRIRAVYHGCEHLEDVEPDVSVINKHGLRSGEYVLAVSSPSRRKNFHSLAAACRLLDGFGHRFVAVGEVNPRVFGGTSQSASEHLQWLGRVSDGELRALYQNAAAFVYPSLYEGFGLPPVEAMMNGCPVIAADIPVLREVCGDAAAFCNPHSPEDIAATIQTVLSDDGLRCRLVAAGRERCRRYRWQQSVERFLDLLRRIDPDALRDLPSAQEDSLAAENNFIQEDEYEHQDDSI